MSIAAVNWARQAGLKGPPQVVLLILATHHNAASGQCNPSLKTIAREAGVGLSSVKRAIEYLSACSLVRVEPQFVDGGRSTSQFWLRVGTKSAPVPRQAKSPSQPRVNLPPEPPEDSPPQPTRYAPPQPRVDLALSAHVGLQKGESTYGPTELGQDCEAGALRLIAGGRRYV
ncbi:helix-turn-helix domain-containing protein [Rubellimicrobium roseum]|uniref:Helix-turn-helix domain-containing protein n=1 Tax=Rubellimicrobium roseum TaxID=687525 RepID=A0A5C4N3K0_9RHOB|nr:helix-turn-helix domain-containing protein [Rubellimicrobium roseum]